MVEARSENAGQIADRSDVAKAGRRWQVAPWKVVVLLILPVAIAWPVAKIVGIQRALAAVESQGGQTIVFRSPDYEGSEVLHYFSWLIGDSQARVRLTGRRITDAELGSLHGLHGLCDLRLDGAAITDSGLKCLRDHQELQALSLKGVAVGDAGLADLQYLTNLRSLCLTNTRVTDATVRSIASLTMLHCLYLDRHGGDRCRSAMCRELRSARGPGFSGTRVTAAGLRNLERWPTSVS